MALPLILAGACSESEATVMIQNPCTGEQGAHGSSTAWIASELINQGFEKREVCELVRFDSQYAEESGKRYEAASSQGRARIDRLLEAHGVLAEQALAESSRPIMEASGS